MEIYLGHWKLLNSKRLTSISQEIIWSILCIVGFGLQAVSQNIKVFYWLLLKNRLNTSGLLKRKNMILESCDCELCLFQKEDKLRHFIL
jgi:hypothetical protein